ncbi:hypothetical protein E2C01_084192 [Portunus trituberculatus]|uniref:Uncharacterized protein n=1 Tax=Portunus trituberculatus TaxID=210409 RepID=A0A5B7J3D0_PORTR|nr:hypothetical protein [Portunus trituberculatus]
MSAYFKNLASELKSPTAPPVSQEMQYSVVCVLSSMPCLSGAFHHILPVSHMAQFDDDDDDDDDNDE